MNALETAKERITKEMASREAQVRELLNNLGDNEEELILSIDTDKVTTVCLSYGGPADYLEITHNEYGIKKVIYRFSDWFDTATEEVAEGSALWEYASYLVDVEEGR